MVKEDSNLLQFDGSAIRTRCEQEPEVGYALLKKFAGLMSMRLDGARRKLMDQWNPDGFA
jgi:CRP/FNR family cyclic AMP-dependent transcriptional regulator